MNNPASSDEPRGPQDRRASIAVDLGAESCRVSLLRWTVSGPDLQLVHRFPNGPVRAADHSLRWPLQTILSGIETGICKAAQLAPEGVRSIAVDGWAVDYVRLDADGHLLGDPFCYRDERTGRAASALHERIAPETIREITGVAQQSFNTLYQPYADRLQDLRPDRWLNLPEYCLFRWGAAPIAEYTNASHTQLVDLWAGNWSSEIFRAAELDLTCAPRIIPPGTLLGKLSGPLSLIPELRDTELIAPACHDTASAVAGIAQTGEDWAYICCGTWSLVGTVTRRPVNSRGAREDNFTNLGAVGGAICFHKGINGMWVLKECMRAWGEDGHPWGIAELLRAAELEEPPVHLLRVDDPSLLRIGDMPTRINAQRTADGVAPLSTLGKNAPAMTSLLLHSLSTRYAEVIARVGIHTDKQIRRIVMVGGGAQNAPLKRLTAERTGLPLVTGPAESSTIGNLAVQLAVLEPQASCTSAQFAQEVAAWARQIGGEPTSA